MTPQPCLAVEPQTVAKWSDVGFLPDAAQNTALELITDVMCVLSQWCVLKRLVVSKRTTDADCTESLLVCIMPPHVC